MAKYCIQLNEADQAHIQKILKKGKHLSRDYLRAQIIQMSHDGVKRRDISMRLRCSYSHVCNTVRHYCTEGLVSAIRDEQRPGRPPKLQGKEHAHLIALACSNPPEGRRCWTMQLLADRCIELGLIDFISDETVRRVLKKTKSSRGRPKAGAFQA